nr:hypothetical protein [Tanacetum cinerariifolium]
GDDEEGSSEDDEDDDMDIEADEEEEEDEHPTVVVASTAADQAPSAEETEPFETDERQTVISELLRTDHRRSTEIIELRTTLHGQGLARGPTQPELPEEAGSGS